MWLVCIIIFAVIILVAIYDVKRTKAMQQVIKSVTIISTDSKKDIEDSVKRGLIGKAILGNVGMVAGVTTGKNDINTTFLVEYIDGSKQTLTVNNDSVEYRRLCEFIDV